MSKETMNDLLQQAYGTTDADQIVDKKRATTGAITRALTPKIHKVKLKPEECKELCRAARIEYLGKETVETTYPATEFKGYEDRVFEYTFTDETVDRYGDVVVAEGMDLKNYRNNPVVLAFHDGRSLPVGNSIKTWYDPTEKAIKGWVLFLDDRVDRSGRSETVHRYVSGGHMKTGSVGFLPDRENEKGYYRPDEEERKARKMPRYGMVAGKAELLEFSVTPIPANPSASMKTLDMFDKASVIAARDAGLIDEKTTTAICDILNERDDSLIRNIEALVGEKAVVAYKKYPFDDDDAAWDGPAEIKAADTDALKVISTWYDSENAEAKSSYKLPHHRASGYNTVWKGVTAAMAALMGARGGVAIPADSKQAVYNHLAKHYKDHDTEPPEMKEYANDAEIDKACGNAWEERDTLLGQIQNAADTVSVEALTKIKELFAKDGDEAMSTLTTKMILLCDKLDALTRTMTRAVEVLTVLHINGTHERDGSEVQENQDFYSEAELIRSVREIVDEE